MINWPEEFLNLNTYAVTHTQHLELKTYERYGFSIIRGLMPEQECVAFNQLIPKATARAFHPVAKEINALHEHLSATTRSEIAATISPLFGDQAGLTGARFLIKDAYQDAEVRPHQDIGYHTGTFDQMSIFIALNAVSIDNGGIQIVVGSHHLGYLGDAGTLNPFYPDESVVCPTLQTGDAILMNASTIHFSKSNKTDSPRNILELLVCDSDQAWREDDLLAERASSNPFGNLDINQAKTLFANSRSQRLQQIRRALDGD